MFASLLGPPQFDICQYSWTPESAEHNRHFVKIDDGILGKSVIISKDKKQKGKYLESKGYFTALFIKYSNIIIKFEKHI